MKYLGKYLGNAVTEMTKRYTTPYWDYFFLSLLSKKETAKRKSYRYLRIVIYWCSYDGERSYNMEAPVLLEGAIKFINLLKFNNQWSYI